MDTDTPRHRPIRLDQLQAGPPLRPIDPGHVALLAEILQDTPPIVIAYPGPVVLDGEHRIAAARLRGWEELLAQVVDTPPQDWLAARLELNVRHGLPLPLEARRDAAMRLLQQNPTRSDRQLASLAGLSPSTIRRLRASGCAGAPGSHVNTRIGIDGKRYPQGTELALVAGA